MSLTASFCSCRRRASFTDSTRVASPAQNTWGEQLEHRDHFGRQLPFTGFASAETEQYAPSAWGTTRPEVTLSPRVLLQNFWQNLWRFMTRIAVSTTSLYHWLTVPALPLTILSRAVLARLATNRLSAQGYESCESCEHRLLPPTTAWSWIDSTMLETPNSSFVCLQAY